MVKLYNIVRDAGFISADYVPVGYENQGSVRVRMSDGVCIEWKKPEGDAGHSWFAKHAVKRLRELIPEATLPKETSAAWY